MKVQIAFVSSNAAAMNFDIGFIPDYVKAYSALGGTELGIEFFKLLADEELSGQYGVATANTGDKSVAADANNGIVTYEEGEDIGVLITHPATGKKVLATISDWNTATTNYASGERSATAIGTIVRPPIHNGKVYELTTDTAYGVSEPSSWDVEPGETVTDGGANIWTCRLEENMKAGGQGFTIGATIAIDSNVWIVVAEKYDKSEYFGDVQGVNPNRFETQKR